MQPRPMYVQLDSHVGHWVTLPRLGQVPSMPTQILIIHLSSSLCVGNSTLKSWRMSGPGFARAKYHVPENPPHFQVRLKGARLPQRLHSTHPRASREITKRSHPMRHSACYLSKQIHVSLICVGTGDTYSVHLTKRTTCYSRSKCVGFPFSSNNQASGNMFLDRCLVYQPIIYHRR